MKSKIKYIENEISTIQNDIKERQEAGKRTRKQNKRLSKMQGLLEDWQKLEKDFDDIISDETIFVYSSERGDIDSKFAGQTGSSEDVFNEKTGRWAKIHIFIEGGRDDIIIHENRHANQRREDPHLSNQHANQLDREKDAYMYHEIYNFQRVEEFIKNQYDSQHGLKDEINRPLFSSYTLEDAIKYFYGIK